MISDPMMGRLAELEQRSRDAERQSKQAMQRMWLLEERIAELTAALGQTQSYVAVLGITRMQDRMVGALMRMQVVRRDTMATVMWYDAKDARDLKGIDVYMMKLRRRLTPQGIAVDTHWGIGWSMPNFSKARVRELVVASGGTVGLQPWFPEAAHA